ncbi:hypothetical protein P5V15_012901 [Pogonomyrmex californicus]
MLIDVVTAPIIPSRAIGDPSVSNIPTAMKLNDKIDYVHWDDPNELMDRLRLLDASYRAGDFSLEDEPRAGRSQKIETDELQALLDINSAQTEKKLAEQLGVTQPFPYVYIRWERFRRKADGFRMNCPKTTKIVGVILHSLCFQSSGKKIFCTKSLQTMKSGFFMIILNVENHGLTLVNL